MKQVIEMNKNITSCSKILFRKRFNGQRGRMISPSDREEAVELIKEAVDSGAALYKACKELGISKRTYNRWKKTDSGYIDKRTICEWPEPANKLSREERKKILEVMNSEEFSSKSPCEIVPILADRGEYLGSESTFYKVLKEEGMLVHRGRARKPHIIKMHFGVVDVQLGAK